MDDGGTRDENQRKNEFERFKKRIGKTTDKKKRCLNVAVIGTPGVGKSSFINTVMASFSGEWRELTSEMCNDGSAKQCTTTLLSFNKDDYITNEEDSMYNFPTLIDIAGFEDTKDDITLEILRMYLYGRLPEDTDLKQIKQDLEQGDTKSLKAKYCNIDDIFKVDRLIVIVSAKSTVMPTKLLEAIFTVAYGEKRKIPMFGVITHMDDARNALYACENIKGYLRLSDVNYLLCSNYCDEYDKTKGISRARNNHPELDIPVIQFMQQVCDPGRKMEDNIHFNDVSKICQEENRRQEQGILGGVFGWIKRYLFQGRNQN